MKSAGTRPSCASPSTTTILRFIEDNWGTGRIGGGSFDADAGSLTNMLDFGNHAFGERRLLLDPTTGEPL